MIPDKNKFTALPTTGNAANLSLAYRKLLKENLLLQLRSLQSGFHINLSEIKKKVTQLDVAKKFSPAVHFAEAKLVAACTAGNLEMIIDVIHSISLFQEKLLYSKKIQVSSILSESWEIDFVSKLRKDNFSQTAEFKIFPILSNNLDYFKNKILRAYKQIKKVDEAFFQEITNYITTIKLFNGSGLVASSSSSVFGAIYLNLPKEKENHLLYFIEHIVHETSHHQLEILFAFDQIILNSKTEKYKSPLRKDPRPMLGIFHATFVLTRMVRIFKKLYELDGNIVYRKKYQEFKKQLIEGVDTVSKHARLTAKGKLVLSSFLQTAEI